MGYGGSFEFNIFSLKMGFDREFLLLRLFTIAFLQQFEVFRRTDISET
jgi:hypothetical protein